MPRAQVSCGLSHATYVHKPSRTQLSHLHGCGQLLKDHGMVGDVDACSRSMGAAACARSASARLFRGKKNMNIGLQQWNCTHRPWEAAPAQPYLCTTRLWAPRGGPHDQQVGRTSGLISRTRRSCRTPPRSCARLEPVKGEFMMRSIVRPQPGLSGARNYPTSLAQFDCSRNRSDIRRHIHGC